MSGRAVLPIVCVLAMSLPRWPGAAAWAQTSPSPQAVPVLTAGFKDHIERVDGGRIDWTNGYILAEGTGKATGTDPQQRQMAQRAAELVAARNALAASQGIRIDAAGRVEGIRSATVQIRGVIRGQQIVESKWQPKARPPRCTVTIKVPLWGAKGVASLFSPTEQAQIQRSNSMRISFSTQPMEVSDFVIVIDARGRRVAPCLFPSVIDEQGRILYDIATLPASAAQILPPARYVETDLTFKALQSRIESQGPAFMLAAADLTATRLDGRWGGRALGGSRHGGFAAYVPPLTEGYSWYLPVALAVAPTATASASASQPASQSAADVGKGGPEVNWVKRRATRRMAVKVADGAGQQKSQLVLTKQDAERLAHSPEATGAMRKAQVIIVVDAPAAGTEGCLPSGWPDPLVDSRLRQ